MARLKTKEVKNQIAEQRKRFYGEETKSGTMAALESDDDTIKALGKVVGEDAVERIAEGKPFNIDDEVARDERKRRTKPNKKA